MNQQTKRSGLGAARPLCALVLLFAAASLQAATTVYVGKHFEVRDHDAPVKYVFNGQTRVARVTGSLSANERIQRLRLRAGWNLLSLAVTAPDFLDQLRQLTGGPAPVIKASYRWQSATRDYAAITSGQSVAAGTVLWVSAQTDAVVAVRGGYVEPSQWAVPGGETFVATPALEAQPLRLPAGAIVWRYDARKQRWQIGLTGDLASWNDLPPTLAPGEAIYVHSNEPADLGAPARDERIRYYHQDHLGSSSVMTDADGALVEETAFYPSGIPRHEHRLRQIEEPYQFTQKERDRESGLHYFEARYLAGGLARFLTLDPKFAHPNALAKADATAFLSNPQEMNMYAYARNNPLRYIDPTGLEVTVTTRQDRPGHKATDIRYTGVLLNDSSRKLTHEQLKSIQARITSQLQSDFSGHGDQQGWNMTVNIRIARSAADIKPDDHVIRLVDKVPVGDDAPRGAVALGRAAVGGKWVQLDASIVDKRPRPDGKHSSLERVVSHEVGHNLGLGHTEETDNPVRHTMGRHNLMGEEDKPPRGTLINVHQIRQIQKDYDAGKFNLGANQ